MVELLGGVSQTSNDHGWLTQTLLLLRSTEPRDAEGSFHRHRQKDIRYRARGVDSGDINLIDKHLN